jgi:hypothetical protein
MTETPTKQSEETIRRVSLSPDGTQVLMKTGSVKENLESAQRKRGISGVKTKPIKNQPDS